MLKDNNICGAECCGVSDKPGRFVSCVIADVFGSGSHFRDFSDPMPLCLLYPVQPMIQSVFFFRPS